MGAVGVTARRVNRAFRRLRPEIVDEIVTLLTEPDYPVTPRGAWFSASTYEGLRVELIPLSCEASYARSLAAR